MRRSSSTSRGGWCSRRSRTPISTRRSPAATASTCRSTTSLGWTRIATRWRRTPGARRRAVIFGGGWLMSHFPGGTPTKDLLDDLVPDRPVFLLNRDVHGVGELQGVGGRTHHARDARPVGRGGSSVTTGEPTGTLHEGAALLVRGHPSRAPSARGMGAGVLLAQNTSTPSASRGGRTPGSRRPRRTRTVARRARRAHRARGRRALVGPASRRRAGRRARRAPRPRLRRHFHPTSVKIMCDGVLENYTGAMLRLLRRGRPRDRPDGDRVPRSRTADEAVVALDARGFQVHMHAIGVGGPQRPGRVRRPGPRTGPGLPSPHHLRVIHPDDVPGSDGSA